jgi:hypothetical protein
MPPRKVVCRCDPQWLAVSVCEVCEARELEAVLHKRGVVAREHPSSDAWDRLAASYTEKTA